MGRGRPRRPLPHLRHPDRHRRDAHLGARAHGAARRRLPRHRPAGRSADRRHHAVPPLRHAGLAAPGSPWHPHYAMEIHLHLAAAYPTEPWVEHFEWLNPLFDERIEIRDGRMWVPDRPGLGFTLSDRMRSLTRETATFGGVTTTLAQRVVARPEGAHPRRLARARGQAAVGDRADRGVRRLADRRPRGGHPAAGRGAGRDVPGTRLLRAGHAGADVVHGRGVGDPQPPRRAGDDRLPARGRERGGVPGSRAAARPRQPSRCGRRSRRSRPAGAERGRRGGLRASTARSRAASGNRFYLDLLDSIGPMMIMLPRTRLPDGVLPHRRRARRAGAPRARQRRRRPSSPATPRRPVPRCGCTSATPGAGSQA